MADHRGLRNFQQASGRKGLTRGFNVGLDTSKTTNPELRAPFATATAGTVLVADPRRNVILRYKPGQDAKDLLEDLKRLLKYAG